MFLGQKGTVKLGYFHEEKNKKAQNLLSQYIMMNKFGTAMFSEKTFFFVCLGNFLAKNGIFLVALIVVFAKI